MLVLGVGEEGAMDAFFFGVAAGKHIDGAYDDRFPGLRMSLQQVVRNCV